MTIDILVPTVGRATLMDSLLSIIRFKFDCNARLIVCADKTGNKLEYIKYMYDSYSNMKDIFYDSKFIVTNGITETYRVLFENVSSDLCLILEDDDRIESSNNNFFNSVFEYFSKNIFLSCVILNSKYTSNINKLNFDYKYNKIRNSDVFTNFPDIFDGEFQFGMCIFKSEYVKNIAVKVFSNLEYYGRTYNDEFIFLRTMLEYKNYYTNFFNECFLLIDDEHNNYSHHNCVNSLIGIDYIYELYKETNNLDWYNKMKSILIREINLVLEENNYLPLFRKEFDFENKDWHREYKKGLLKLKNNDEELIKRYKNSFINKFLSKRSLDIGY